MRPPEAGTSIPSDKEEQMSTLQTSTPHPARSSLLSGLLVQEVMHRGVLTAPLTTPLSAVARMMARYRVHCIVALAERPYDQGPRVWKLVSDLDLIRAAASADIDDRTAGGSATGEVLTVEPTDSLRHAAELMSEQGVSHVIVVDPSTDRPVGVLSTLDVASALAGEQPREQGGASHVVELMTRNVLTVGPDRPLKEVALLLAEHGFSGVPVVENGRVLGVVSEADIVAKERGPAPRRGRLAQLLRRPKHVDWDRVLARTAGEAMTTPAITIESWRSAADAAALMLDRDVERLPVLKDDRLVGIITRADLVRAFARTDEELEHDVREDVMLRTFWVPPGEIEIEVRNGEVTLRGTVDSDVGAELLPEAVQRVPGVVAVHADLKVRADPERGHLEWLSPR
jgi:CBS domain-containing protein